MRTRKSAEVLVMCPRIILYSLLLSGLALAPGVRGQVVIESEPDGPSLLDFARQRAERQGWVDLRDADLDPGDVEVRAYGGFGLGGTHLFSMRRRGGEWSASASYVVTCEAPGHTSPPDSLSVCAEAEGADVSLVPGDSLFAARPPTQDRLQLLWERLVEAGVQDLPPETERQVLMLDGHSVVIEYREGRRYRATSVATVEPLEEVEKGIRAIRLAIVEELGVLL